MFKIDWSQAPDWANYWTFDRAGAFWWGDSPKFYEGEEWLAPGCVFVDCAPDFGFKDSRSGIHQRPKATMDDHPAQSTEGASLVTSSKHSYAYDPSEEYSYTWFEPGWESGEFYKTAAEAEKAARKNYLSFEGNLKKRTVYVARIVSVVNDGENNAN